MHQLLQGTKKEHVIRPTLQERAGVTNERKHLKKVTPKISLRVTGHSQIKNKATDKEKTTGVGIKARNNVPWGKQ